MKSMGPIRDKWTKGQGMAIDFFFAVIILLIVIGMAATSWSRTVYLIDKNAEMRWMRRTGLAVADMMVRSPGVPSDWNSSNVMTIGLVDRTNVLDKEKVAEFNSVPKSKIQQLFGIGGYDFSFRVRAYNGTVLSDYGSAPSSAGDVSDVVVVRRLALYDGIPVRIEFGMWEA